MLNATEFSYDGVYSGKYGLLIATINGDSLGETSYIVPEISTSKSANSKRFYYGGMSYSEPPTYQFSLVSPTPLPDAVQREVMTWLDSRKGFRRLDIYQPEFLDYYFMCIFTIDQIIYHKGFCVGFNITATFDSPFQYKRIPKTKISSDGTTKTVIVLNASDVPDDYIYPKITFKSKGYLTPMTDGNKVIDENCNIWIANKTDFEATGNLRPFTFYKVTNNTTITVDNELKIIDGDAHLGNFKDKNWFRLLPGKNEIEVMINGEATIELLEYVKIRF